MESREVFGREERERGWEMRRRKKRRKRRRRR